MYPKLISIRYDDIIEIEVNFLLKNFTSQVSQDFDDAIELIVAGSKPYCGRALDFAIKRLHGKDSTTAWASLMDRPKYAVMPLGRDLPTNSPFGLLRPGTVNGKERENNPREFLGAV